MEIDPKEVKRLQGIFAQLKSDRRDFWELWRDVANYFLPKRYVWLMSEQENKRAKSARNPMILDPTGTLAARTLASGMMNGITSPSRPWLSIRAGGLEHNDDAIAAWEQEVVRRILTVMAESNFYTSMAILYLDLVIFGSAANLIYEDDSNVIHCFNPALGEFYFGQNEKLQVDIFARHFKFSSLQLLKEFGEENLPTQIAKDAKEGGAKSLTTWTVIHLIEPNNDTNSGVSDEFAYRETYWLESEISKNQVLRQKGFNELPGIFARWELTGNDAYGTAPAIDALSDVIQIQHQTKRKAQGLDKTVNPPIVADIQLEHRPTALMPNGITYVAGSNSIGAKPLYQINLPLQELTEDISRVQVRIRETMHNDLFRMISQLDTVRSATEIDARREEKLVLLGSVLDRFEKEALSPAINRIYAIMLRKGLIPEPPDSLPDGTSLEIEYVSILSVAQRAVTAAPTERWVQLIGNLAGVAPQVTQIPDWEELVRNYGDSIGVPARDMKSRERVAQVQEEEAARAQEQEAAARSAELIDGAQTLSETEVGGGSNALQQLLAQS